MAIESEQIKAVENKTLIFLKELMKKNPTQNYHGAAVIAMSALDIDAEMRNPNSKIRKDFLAAIEIQEFIAFCNNVLLPEMVKRDIEIREMLEGIDIYPKSAPGQPLSERDFEGLPNQDAEKVKPLRGIIEDVKKLENLTLKLQHFEIDWRLEKINFVKEKLEGALKKVEEKISTLPDEDPGKKELIDTAKELKKDIIELNNLKDELQQLKRTEYDPTKNLSLLGKCDDILSTLPEKLTKTADPDISSLSNTLKNGLENIDSRRIIEYKGMLQEISSLEKNITTSIEKFEDTFGKKLGLGEALDQYKLGQNHNLSALKDTLNLDIPHEKAHDSNHFKK